MHRERFPPASRLETTTIRQTSQFMAINSGSCFPNHCPRPINPSLRVYYTPHSLSGTTNVCLFRRITITDLCGSRRVESDRNLHECLVVACFNAIRPFYCPRCQLGAVPLHFIGRFSGESKSAVIRVFTGRFAIQEISAHNTHSLCPLPCHRNATQ